MGSPKIYSKRRVRVKVLYFQANWHSLKDLVNLLELAGKENYHREIVDTYYRLERKSMEEKEFGARALFQPHSEDGSELMLEEPPKLVTLEGKAELRKGTWILAGEKNDIWWMYDDNLKARYEKSDGSEPKKSPGLIELFSKEKKVYATQLLSINDVILVGDASVGGIEAKNLKEVKENKDGNFSVDLFGDEHTGQKGCFVMKPVGEDIGYFCDASVFKESYEESN